MTDVGRSSSADALEKYKIHSAAEADPTPDFQNNFYLYLVRLLTAACISAVFIYFEFKILYTAQSSLLMVFILILTEFLFYTNIHRHASQSPDFGFVHDLFWAGMAPLVAIFARESFPLSRAEVDGSTIYVIASFCTAMCVFPLFSMRKELWGFTSLPDLLRIGGAIALNVVLVTFIVFIINRHEGVARTIPMLHLLFLLVPILGLRIVYKFSRQRFEARIGRPVAAVNEGGLAVAPEHVLLIGVNRLSEFYIDLINQLGDGSVEVIGLLANDPQQCGCQIRSVPVVGTSSELQNVLHEFDVRGINTDRLVFCCPWQRLSSAAQRAVMDAKVQRRIRIHQVEDRLEPLNEFFGFRRDNQTPPSSLLGKTEARQSATSGQLDCNRRHREVNGGAQGLEVSSYFRFKRLFDIMVAVVLLIVFSPVMILVGLIVSATIGFPGIFWQRRPGRGGEGFKIYKFRTMLPPFDRNGNRVAEAARTTRLCRILRRSRLDELPQLFNVLRGDMSLVGPRPLLPVDQPRDASLRLLIRPGVTGWRQVNGGPELTAEESLALDVWYARRASFWLDLKIICRSIIVVFRGDRKMEAAIGEAMSELAAYRTSTVESLSGFN